MKLLRLDLTAFGPFTDLTLDFSGGDHGLHLVYGPNEAGKSSSLRAIRRLLFGIPPQNDDNFLHSYPNLRVGAQLLDHDGQTHEVIRRKGSKNTLRGRDDIEIIAPEIIESMVSGIDEMTFCSQFGIGLDQLIDGGRQIAEGQGEAGSTLFAAASGITGLNAVLEKLDSEAKQLFLKAGKVPKINQALGALKRAKKCIKEKSLPSDEWTRHYEALQAAKDRKLAIDRELEQVTSERSRLDRIRQALPIVPAYLQLKEEASSLADAPQLAADFSESRRRAMSELNMAKVQQETVQQTIERWQKEIDKLDSPTAILQEAERIERIVTKLGGYQDNESDLPGLMDEHQRIESNILKAMTSLGGESESACITIRPEIKVRIRELASQRQTHVDRQNTAAESLRALDQSLTDVRQTLAKLPSGDPRDVAALKRTVRDLEPQRDVESELAESERRLRKLEKQADVDLSRLPNWSASLDDLERLPLPTRETIDRHDDALRSSQATVDQAAEVLKSITAELHEKDSQLDRLEREQDIPSEKDLEAARRRRALGWRLVRKSWQNGTEICHEQQAFLKHFPSAADLTEAFDQSIEAADLIVDRLRREAEAVSQKAALIAGQAELSERLNRCERSFAKATTEADEAKRQWSELWAAIQVVARTPREMREWIARQQELVDLAQEVRSQRDDVAQLEQSIGEQKRRLSEAFLQLGEDLFPVNESVTIQVEYGVKLIEQRAAMDQQRQNALRDEKRLVQEQADAQRAVDDANRALKEWNTDWSKAIVPLGLAGDASVAQADAILDTVAEISQMTDESSSLSERITGINTRCRQFQSEVISVCEYVAKDLVEVARDTVESAVVECRERLTTARETKIQLDKLHQQQTEQNKLLQRATVERNEAEAKLKALCHEAGCESPDDLQECENRSAQRSANAEKLRSLDEQLLGLSAGKSVDEFIAEIQQIDADRLPATIQQSEQRLSELNDEKSDVDATIGSEQTHLEKFDHCAEAAQASEDAEHLRASIAEDAEHYARLRLASVVLQGAIERYRDQHQGPLLRRASELFSELTLGHFEELRTDYNARGKVALLGVRKDRRASVGTAEMSDGTCDQLYLALRLASLELHFQSNPAIPFIVDDILNRFDDDRAVAALKMLARLSSITQVIFFTHHEHLVRLATENLDDDVLFTHRLELLAQSEI